MAGTVDIVGIKHLQDVAQYVENFYCQSVAELNFDVVIDVHIVDAELKSYWKNSVDIFRSRKKINNLRVWKIPNCIIVPPHMLIVDSDGYLIFESIRKESIVNLDDRFSYLFNNENGKSVLNYSYAPRVRSGYLLNVAQHWNYYHFLIESLPRVDWIANQRNLGMEAIISSPEKKFHRELYDIFISGIMNFSNINKPTFFSEMYFIDLLARSNVRISTFVRDYFRSKIDYNNVSDKKIYISRRDAETRRITNEEALFIELKKRGFEFVEASKLSVREQIQLFANAESVVAPHGAGLANISFCRKGTKIIEILPSSFREGVTSYAALSELFELDYTLYVAQAEQADYAALSDMTVNIDYFTSVIDRL